MPVSYLTCISYVQKINKWMNITALWANWYHQVKKEETHTNKPNLQSVKNNNIFKAKLPFSSHKQGQTQSMPQSQSLPHAFLLPRFCCWLLLSRELCRGAPSAPDTASIPESERKSGKGNTEKKTQPHRKSATQLELKDSSYYWRRDIPAHLAVPPGSPRPLPSQLPSQLCCGCTATAVAPPHTAHYSH